MDNEFIYWNHITAPGIRVEEISGGKAPSVKIWREMAYQIYGEHGDNGIFRIIDHYPDGAPFLEDSNCRISITHTSDFLAVSSLPEVSEINLEKFNPLTALGIDAEALNRNQVLKVRTKFLSEEELKIIDEEDLTANILAWTAKEALYKVALNPGLNFKDDIRIDRLPTLNKAENRKNLNLGKARIFISEKEEEPKKEIEMLLYSYESEGNCVTLAFSPSTKGIKLK